MYNGEEQYLQILRHILANGQRKENRTGVDTVAVPPVTIYHDMSEGFPLLTTKKMAWKGIRTELEFFLKGLTDKQWLLDRKCHIWDQWHNPQSADQTDLGPVYGHQWRDFGGDYVRKVSARPASSVTKDGFDQLADLVHKLHTNPNDRRMVVSAWSPQQIPQMALPPCHLLWNVNHINGTLHLHWHQRSCDMFLGVPFNIASYALLLHLLALEGGFTAGQLSGTFVDCHIYVNHLKQIQEQLGRTLYKLPTISTKNFTNIFDWQADQTEVLDYQCHPAIKADVAV